MTGMPGGSGTAEPVDILLVEDHPGDIRLTKEAFEEGRIENTLHVVEDGDEALDFIFQRNEYADAPRPDLILLDLYLPTMDGDEVLEELRGDPETQTIPVVVLTSSDSEADMVETYGHGANAYLTKPVDPEGFIEAIQALEEFWLSIVRLPPDTDSN